MVTGDGDGLQLDVAWHDTIQALRHGGKVRLAGQHIPHIVENEPLPRPEVVVVRVGVWVYDDAAAAPEEGGHKQRRGLCHRLQEQGGREVAIDDDGDFGWL